MEKNYNIKKKVTHSVTSNFIWNAILKLLAVIFPLLTFPYATRCLGADSLGRVSFASSIISYFSLCANLGIPTYGIRVCSAIRDDKEKLSRTVHEILMINTVTMGISYFALWLSITFVPRLAEEKTLILISSISLAFSCIGMEWLYSAIEEYKYITMRSFIFKIVSMILLFLTVKDQNDYLVYAAITVVASVGANIFNLIRIRKIIYVKVLKGYEFKRHFKPIITFFAASIAILVYTHIDTAMLGFLSSNTEVGYYTVAVKIKAVLLNMITSVGVVLLPRITYYVSNEQDKLAEQLIRKTIHMILLVSIPCVVFFELESLLSIDVIAGIQYYPAEISMKLLIPLLLIVGMANVLVYQFILPRGMEKIYCYITIVSAAIDIIINAFLIPYYGAAGAAVGTLVAESVGLIVEIYILRKDFFPIIGNIRINKIILATGVACIIERLIVYSFKGEISSIIALLLYAFIFFGVYGIILLILKDSLIWESIDKCFFMLKSWKK